MQDQRPRTHAPMDEVSPAIVVPERTGVLQLRLRDHRHRCAPWAGGIAGRHHEDALGGRGEIDIEATLVMADGRRPHARAVPMSHLREKARALRAVAETE